MTKKTALYQKHSALGAKIVEFAGYYMPIQYTSITEEHLAVRNSAGIFDVSHMGEFIFEGEDALPELNRLTINDVSKLEIGQVQYSAMCYANGGMVDDLLIYRFADHFMMVVNAANLAKDFKHLKDNLKGKVKLTDVSDETTLLALQGPKSGEILQTLTKTALNNIKYYWFAEGEVAGVKALISRTGYTGEFGYELYVDFKDSERLWDAIMFAGKPWGLKPVGLGARDSLRLEMKYCLYGNDISQDTNPLEAGLGWITKLKKGDFIGCEALSKVKESGLKRMLVGFEVEGKAFPRQHYPVLIDGLQVGEVTSGTFSPVLSKGIGLTYLPIEKSQIGNEIAIDIRGRLVPGRVVKTPFIEK
jgi:aminomethyltransferase